MRSVIPILLLDAVLLISHASCGDDDDSTVDDDSDGADDDDDANGVGPSGRSRHLGLRVPVVGCRKATHRASLEVGFQMLPARATS